MHAQARRQRLPGPDHDTAEQSQNYSLVDGIGDIYLEVPRTINVNAPAFEQAAKTCNFH